MIPDWLENITGLSVQDSDPARTGQDIIVTAPVSELPELAGLINSRKLFIEDLTVVDISEGLLLSWHFCQYQPHLRLTLRALVPHDQAEAPSISAIYPGADWQEREAAEMYGLVFSGHPHLVALLLDDNAPGPPPLLKTPETRRPLDAFGPAEAKKE